MSDFRPGCRLRELISDGRIDPLKLHQKYFNILPPPSSPPSITQIFSYSASLFYNQWFSHDELQQQGTLQNNVLLNLPNLSKISNPNIIKQRLQLRQQPQLNHAALPPNAPTR